MPTWTEVLGDGANGREKPLGVARGLKPVHAPLALTGGLVRVLRTIIEIPMLAMFHSWEQLSLSCSIPLQFVGDDDPRYVGQPLEQLTEALVRGALIPPTWTKLSSTLPSCSTARHR